MQLDDRVPLGWTIPQWQHGYQEGRLEPEFLISWASELSTSDPAWISVATEAQLREQLDGLAELLDRAGGDRTRLPLYGVPFAVKDNIDVASWPTTAACPEFAYTAERDATVVAKLRAAGGVVLGKTNLDQFATGLAGNRSPYGAVRTPFDERYVAGGSSSGSASVVARGLVPFALGTDTAGSGRVPAGFNNIVGLKPTRGRLSTFGVVPACRTLDCVSVFALTVSDSELVTRLVEGRDPLDEFTRSPVSSFGPARGGEGSRRPILAVPLELEFFGDRAAEAAFRRDLASLERSGATLRPLDFQPFRDLARLLYEGPWVAERYLAVRKLLEATPDVIHPAVRRLIERAKDFSAADAFAAEYERVRLASHIHELLADVDALVVPTAPTHYTVEAVEADPIGSVMRLGYYTNFANLADLCGLAVPGSHRDDGLPAGLTFLAPAWHDHRLAEIARAWEASLGGELGKTSRPRAAALEGPGSGPAVAPEPGAEPTIALAVVGAHLSGLPLNHQLTERGARLLEKTTTAPRYALHALAGTQPPKPGLVRSSAGAAIEVEVWSIPLREFGSFVALVPPPLAIGNVELVDGRWVKGFVCEGYALDTAEDITRYGGWRAYLSRAEPSQRSLAE